MKSSIGTNEKYTMIVSHTLQQKIPLLLSENSTKGDYSLSRQNGFKWLKEFQNKADKTKLVLPRDLIVGNGVT